MASQTHQKIHVPSRYGKAFKDLVLSIRMAHIWHLLAFQEVRQRYRRSTLGPLWMSVSIAVQVAVVGLLLSVLFGQNNARFLPYFTVSLVLWVFISSAINESAMALISSPILQFNRPILIYIFQSIWRNLLTSVHHVVVIVAVMVLFAIPPTWNMLWVIVTIPLLIINLTWVCVIISIMSTRFRDVPMIIQNGLTIVFWMTPIFYEKGQLRHLQILADINPLYHVIEVVRAPLLGGDLPLLSLGVVLGIAVLGPALAFVFFSHFRHRIAYWV